METGVEEVGWKIESRAFGRRAEQIFATALFTAKKKANFDRR